MGREVRKVPPHWQHPERDPDHDSYRRGGLQPMYDEHFETRFAAWLADFDRIRAGNLTDFERKCYPLGLAEWLIDEGQPPDPTYYRPWKDEEATWFQVWETVSEGTPVTPPFATREELAEYLAKNGDFWDQKRGDGAWSLERARQFVESGWAPTGIAVRTAIGVVFAAPRDPVPSP